MGEVGLDRGWWAPFIILSIGSIHRLRLRAFCIKEAGGRRGAPTLFSILGVPKKFSRGNISLFDNYYFPAKNLFDLISVFKLFWLSNSPSLLVFPLLPPVLNVDPPEQRKNSNMIYSKKMTQSANS